MTIADCAAVGNMGPSGLARSFTCSFDHDETDENFPFFFITLPLLCRSLKADFRKALNKLYYKDHNEALPNPRPTCCLGLRGASVPLATGAGEPQIRDLHGRRWQQSITGHLRWNFFSSLLWVYFAF